MQVLTNLTEEQPSTVGRDGEIQIYDRRWGLTSGVLLLLVVGGPVEIPRSSICFCALGERSDLRLVFNIPFKSGQD